MIILETTRSGEFVREFSSIGDISMEYALDYTFIHDIARDNTRRVQELMSSASTHTLMLCSLNGHYFMFKYGM